MRVYDITLGVIRALVAISLIRELITLGIDSFRFVAMPAMFGNYDGIGSGRLTFMFAPVGSLLASLIILAFSKSLARFAAKLSAVSDAADQF